jgi:Flp pilus assembly protein TadD
MHLALKRILPAVAVLLAAASGLWWWRVSQPRVLTVCLFPDNAFRLRPNWQATLQARVAAVSRLWEREAGIRWQIVKVEAEDPTAYVPGYENRRRELPKAALRSADLLISVTGVHEGDREGDVSPFAHSALLVDFPDQPEPENVRRMSRQLTLLFGVPAAAAATDGDGFSPRVRRLVRRLRGYDFSIGAAALEAGWDARAASALTEACQGLAPNPAARAHQILAAAFQADGRNWAAIPHLREALRLEPANVPTRMSLAAALAEDSRVDEAIAVVRQGIARSPANSPLHRELGALLVKRDPVAAQTEYRQALHLDPSDAKAYAGLGTLLAGGNGVIDEAIRMFERALELDSELPEAQTGLVAALKRRTSMQAEIESLRKSAETGPPNGEAFYALGIAQMRAGDYESASRSLSRAAQLSPRDAKPHAMLAIVCLARNDVAGAWQEVAAARALGLEPEPSLLHALQKKSAH